LYYILSSGARQALLPRLTPLQKKTLQGILKGDRLISVLLKQPAIKYPIILLYGVFLILPFFVRYYGSHLELPKGCDEFGYLNMAQAISQGRLFKSHTERPFDKNLIPYLQSSSYDYKDYLHIICPHAHHLDSHSYKIINQYPPGTSLLLSFLPIDQRKPASPIIFAFLLVFFLMLAHKVKYHEISFFHVHLVSVIVLIFFVSPPFKQQFSTVNSVAPTFGLLLAAGYLLNTHPRLSIALLGMSTLFRISNVILIIPFFFIYFARRALKTNFLRESLVTAIKTLLLFLAGGLGLYLVYAWRLLGNPFFSTYSYFDQNFTHLKDIPGNVSYYLSMHSQWFILHALILGVIILMALLKKIPKESLIFACMITLMNYCFYLTHRVRIAYYPYASAIILSGFLLNHLEDIAHNKLWRNMIHCLGFAIVLSAIVFTFLKFPAQNAARSFDNQIRMYRNCFSEYDVIWAGERSGTIEYATGKASFRYEWGPPQVRKDITRWLKTNGYRQAIWTADLANESTIAVEGDLKDCPGLGTVIEIH
jgi:hypothetical protein